MRDRNAPRKRVSMREAGKASPIPGAHNIYDNNPMAYPVGGSSSESYTGPSSDASVSPRSSSSRISGRQADPRRLLDFYYKYDTQKEFQAGIDRRRLLPIFHSREFPIMPSRHRRQRSDA